jgi:hypothetical protein
VVDFLVRIFRILLQDRFGIRVLNLPSFFSFCNKGETMAAKRKAEADIWTQNQEEAQVYVNTLKAAMTVFDVAKLSDDHRVILDALDDENSMVSSIV